MVKSYWNKVANLANIQSRQNDAAEIVAIVTESNHKANEVSIAYVDSNGSYGNKSNVQVRQYGNVNGWFPSVDDVVIVQQKLDNMIVVARAFDPSNRKDMQLTHDVYSDTNKYAVGGVIH